MSKAKKLFILGNSKEHGMNISLEDFSWDCGWYWGGGYLGNSNCHYHMDSYFNPRENAFDAIKRDFGESLRLTDEQLWRLLDLFKQFYAHQKSAEAFSIGGHMTSKGRTEEEINKGMARQINEHIRDVIIVEVQKLAEQIKQNRFEKQ